MAQLLDTDSNAVAGFKYTHKNKACIKATKMTSYSNGLIAVLASSTLNASSYGADQMSLCFSSYWQCTEVQSWQPIILLVDTVINLSKWKGDK